MKTRFNSSVALAFFAFLAFATLPGARAGQFNILGPAGSGLFGQSVTVLPNGNFVVTDPGFAAPGPITNVGAVYLYDGVTLAVISTLTGSTAGDQIGNAGVTVFSNGNYVVRSSAWNGSRGALTWGNGTTGVTGAVAAVNSLIGSTASDFVGNGGITVLSNGNFLVLSSAWNSSRGAVTWGDGTTGVTGAVSTANSLVGSTVSDQVGNAGVMVLSNGNYVVRSSAWSGSRGAVTWGNGTSGVSGEVSAANSLVGSTVSDQVGNADVTLLNNGNYVVRSWAWNGSRGAVTWGNGTNGVSGEVSTANSLVGGTVSDRVGLAGIRVLSNGNYVVSSLNWDNGAASDAGAVTWGSGTAGVSGVISAANSLVGSTAGDKIGDGGGVMDLTNGNYLVRSPNWDNGAVTNAGAVTWGSGTAGVSGVISAANSLVGSTAGDKIGDGGDGVEVLINGNYVVFSQIWDNGAVVDAGAVTWGSGTTGVSGAVSAANSLVGSTEYDRVGDSFRTALANGNYVVCSRYWNYSRGAVTWGSGTTGVNGVVSAANSLVGNGTIERGDDVGNRGAIALNNGNYVVCSSSWKNGAAIYAGAVTWGNGLGGTVGAVSAANSLVGSTEYDQVGIEGVPLPNGNYLAISYRWNNSMGAVTWVSGTVGVSGAVSAANSLVGTTAGDSVGNNRAITLPNGNYVVRSPYWDNGAVFNAGAMTWGNGLGGTVGAVSAANSLVGTTGADPLDINGVIALPNGDYVVRSPDWDNGAAIKAGAVTWGSGTAGVSGVISATNSLVGSTANDQVGNGADGVRVLINGNYVVRSPNWDNGAAPNAGAVTWGSGTTGVRGGVSAANSLVGSTTSDQVGSVAILNDGNYVVSSTSWDNGAVTNAGAMTLGDGTLGTTGAVSTTNSVLGTVASGGSSMVFAFDYPNTRLLVGYRGGNRVSLFSYTPEISVEQPAGTNLLDGTASIDFGSVIFGGIGEPKSFTITNAGSSNLILTNFTKDGSHPGDFTVSAPGATTLAPSASTTFTVTFSPTAAGWRSAALHLASNDSNENPFDISLTGTATTPPFALHSPVITPGHFTFGIASAAGITVNLERAISPAGPWTNIGSILTDPSGIGLFQDTNPPAGSAFYRARQQ